MVFGRDDFELRGQVPVGIGIRFVHLTRNGRWLLASNGSQHFYWDAQELARRFQGDGPARPDPSD